MTYPLPSTSTLRLVDPAEFLSVLQEIAAQQGDPDLQAELAASHSRLAPAQEWNFLLEEAGRLLASLGLRSTAPGQAMLFGLTLPWADAPVSLGAALFRQAFTLVHSQGVTRVRHLIPAQASHGQTVQAIFATLTVPPTREIVQYIWPGGDPPEPNTRLTYRTLPEVGEAVFLQAIERSLNGTLDQVDQQEVERVGSSARALELYRILRGIQAPDEWWNLAYDERGDLVGLIVINALGEKWGTVGYLAVLPEARGQGYGYDLLVQGTLTLLRAGHHQILLDTDVTNLPTQHLNERAGYQRLGVARQYVVTLAQAQRPVKRDNGHP